MPLKKYDVVVVGGGIIGAAIAYYLSKKNAKVLVLERNVVASGSSRANGGNVLLQDKLPGPSLELTKSSFLLYKNLLQEIEYNVGYVKTSGLLVAETEQDWEVVKSHSKKLLASGIQVRLISPDELRSQEPLLAKDLYGASECPDEFKVNSIMLTIALLQKSKEMGAEVLEGTKVIGFKMTDKKLNSILTNNDEIYSDCAVIAAGVWTAEFSRMLNANIPVRPRKGQMLVTEVWPEAPKRTMLAAGYLSAKYFPGPANQSNLLGDFTCSKTEEGNCLIGSCREFSDYSVHNTPEALRMVAQRACRFIPSLKNVKIIRTFAGLRPFTPDHRPIIGKVENWPGIFIATGHEGEGIQLAPITGKIISNLIINGATDDLSMFALSRFSRKT